MERVLDNSIIYIERAIGRSLTNVERSEISKQLMMDVQKAQVNKIAPDRAIRRLISAFIHNLQTFNSIRSAVPRTDHIDMHEYISAQLRTIDVEDASQRVSSLTGTKTKEVSEDRSVLGYTNLPSLVRDFSLSSLPDRVQICLDTKYRSLETDGTTVFKWYFSTEPVAQQGISTTVFVPHNVFRIKIMPLRIPYLDQVDNNPHKLITMSVRELSSQATVIGSTSYQFAFRSSVDDTWIDLDPYPFNKGNFTLNDILTNLNSMTVSFYDPENILTFKVDRLYGSVFSYGSPTVITTTSSHNLYTGDKVFCTGFTTTNPDTDYAVINAINSTNGLVISYIDDTSFFIDTDTKSVNLAGPGTVALTNGSDIVIGTGTSFLTFFRPGDTIDVSGSLKTVVSIATNIQLVVDSNYSSTASGLVYNRNNIDSSLVLSLFFDSRRIFIHMLIEYYK
jgi:hypothetical protein